MKAGIEVRHIAQGCNVSMYKTNIQCESAGVFKGPMVVSMRPMTPENAQKAKEIDSDLIVMDCIGYTEAAKKLVRKISGKPVILCRTMLARVISEWVDV